MQTMVRTRIALNDLEFFLAQGQDAAKIRREMEDAVRGGGGFVEFIVVGNRSVSVLVSAGTQIVFTHETVELDVRDTGDDTAPYGGDYDLL